MINDHKRLFMGEHTGRSIGTEQRSSNVDPVFVVVGVFECGLKFDSGLDGSRNHNAVES